MLGSVFGVRPPVFRLLLVFSFIIYSFIIPIQTPDFGRCFSAPGRASCFEARIEFRVPQNTTCNVLVNIKIRPKRRIKCSREKQLRAVCFLTNISYCICIRRLIKFILQSKALFNKVLHCIIGPGNAKERHLVPYLMKA
jgi:hypothetical protein